MIDFESIQKKAKIDIESALEIWKNVLLEFFNEKLDFLYAKGSAVKNWESIIDYVPVISDLDIHFKMLEGTELFEEHSVEESLRLAKTFEDRFVEQNDEYLHVPRIQLNFLNRLVNLVSYVPPAKKSIRTIFGKIPDYTYPPAHTIRDFDFENLMEVQPFLEKLPFTCMDCVSYEYWGLIRQFTWRVSPSPVRLLTQLMDDPLEVWTWNRTRTSEVLERKGFDNIADSYRGFYEAGWQLFLSDLKSREHHQEMIRCGNRLLKECVHEAKAIRD